MFRKLKATWKAMVIIHRKKKSVDTKINYQMFSQSCLYRNLKKLYAVQ